MSLLDLFHARRMFRRRRNGRREWNARIDLVTPLWAGEHADTRRAYARALGARDQANRLADLVYQLRIVEHWFLHDLAAVEAIGACRRALELERRRLVRSIEERGAA